MARPTDDRESHPRPRPSGLVFFAITTVAIAFTETALTWAANPGPWGWVSVLIPAGAVVYVAAGLLAWVRRPRNRMGPLLCAGGLLWFASGAVSVENPTLFGLGLVAQTLPIAFVAHALLAYPSGRLRSVASWSLTVGVYVVAVVLQAPLYLFRTLGGEPPVLWIAARPELVESFRQVQAVAGLVVLATTGVVLVLRVLAADRTQRRVLAPIYLCGAVVVALVTSVRVILRQFGISGSPALDAFQIGILVLVPVAFVTGVLLGGFARTGELDELAEWLGSRGARPDVQYAVARTLGDPSVCLAHRFGEGWVDGNGMPIELPAARRTGRHVRRAGRSTGGGDPLRPHDQPGRRTRGRRRSRGRHRPGPTAPHRAAAGQSRGAARVALPARRGR